jgi:hypothetical protein
MRPSSSRHHPATRLAGLRLFDIKCAWFGEDQYCELFPRTVLAPRNERGTQAGACHAVKAARKRKLRLAPYAPPPRKRVAPLSVSAHAN